MPTAFRFTVQAASPPAGSSWAELAPQGSKRSATRRSRCRTTSTTSTPSRPRSWPRPTPPPTLRIGSLTYCNDYRHPVVLAKEAATLDLLSGGRLEFGLGAGWMTTDYEQSGIAPRPARRPHRPPGRGARDHHRAVGGRTLHRRRPALPVRGLDGRPKPLQQPRPPILIGGGGRKVLTLAAQRADMIGLNIALGAGRIDEHAGPSATAEATLGKIEWIRAAAGPRFDDIELQVRVHLALVTEDRVGVAHAVAPDLRADPGPGPRVAPRTGRHGRRDRRAVPRPARALWHLVHRARPRRHGGHGPGGGPPRRHLSRSVR